MLRVFDCFPWLLSSKQGSYGLEFGTGLGTVLLAPPGWLCWLYMCLLYLQEACIHVHARRLVSEYFQGWILGSFGNTSRFQSERRWLLYWSLLGIQNRTKQNNNKKAAGSSALRLTQEPSWKGILIRKLCSPSPRDNEKCFAFNHLVVGHREGHKQQTHITG